MCKVGIPVTYTLKYLELIKDKVIIVKKQKNQKKQNLIVNYVKIIKKILLISSKLKENKEEQMGNIQIESMKILGKLNRPFDFIRTVF